MKWFCVFSITMAVHLAKTTSSSSSPIPQDSWQPTHVVLETTMGEITIELYWKHAPNTCRNFAALADTGYYDNVVFHRVIQDFMIQGGDPTGTGTGGSSIYGKTFPDEFHKDLEFTEPGLVAMANAGPNTNGSQFFMTLAPTHWLNGKHTIFGRVSGGDDIVKKMGAVKTDKYDRPVAEIKIIKARVKEA